MTASDIRIIVRFDIECVWLDRCFLIHAGRYLWESVSSSHEEKVPVTETKPD
jgi:hypothetical protein